MQDYITEAQNATSEEVNRIVEEKKIKEKVTAEAQELAKVAAKHILDPSEPDLEPFPSIDIEGDKKLEYLLVMEFLQSAGFKFAPSVLMYESRHPDVTLDRREFGKELGLCTYDRTPYLVQLIENRLNHAE